MLFFISLVLQVIFCDCLILQEQSATILDLPNTSLHSIEKPRKSKSSNQKVLPANVNEGQESCAVLTNVRGTHYTVSVHVGTPGQKFDVVADTGSSNLIVESCQCRDSGFCGAINKCFVEKDSSTVKVKQGSDGPETVVLMFGSGPIESVIATDEVTMGSLTCNLNDGVLLMVDQLLSFSGPFEGIMGLGLPENLQPETSLLQTEAQTLYFPTNTSSSNKTETSYIPTNSSQTGHNNSAGFFTHHTQTDYIWTPKFFNHSELDTTRFGAKHAKIRRDSDDAFLQKVGVKRFSMCLSEDGWSGDSGVLRFNSPQMPNSLNTIGDMHWALDFRGISIGNDANTGEICSSAGMDPGQLSPCGAIMDSGTTYILGPRDDVQNLYGQICDQWPRCTANFTAMQNAAAAANEAIQKAFSVNPQRSDFPMEKASVFTALLRDCNSWFNDKEGLNELPQLHFHVADGDKKITLDLDPWSYIVSKNQKEMKYYQESIPGIGAIIMDYNVTGRMTWSCTPTFGAVDYPTAKNGPGWILGIPFFYEYNIHYDLSSQPPSMAFSRESCGRCDAQGYHSLNKERLNTKPKHKPVRLPRRVHGDPRIPSIYFEAPYNVM